MLYFAVLGGIIQISDIFCVKFLRAKQSHIVVTVPLQTNIYQNKKKMLIAKMQFVALTDTVINIIVMFVFSIFLSRYKHRHNKY